MTRLPLLLTPLLAPLLAVGALLATAAPAQAAPLPAGYHWGRCLLKVAGKAYIQGRCSYYPLNGGSFVVEGPKQDYSGLDSGKPLAALRSTDHFAQVDVHGATADATWNKDITDMHAQDPLGLLHRKGACWVNAQAQICLWKQ